MNSTPGSQNEQRRFPRFDITDDLMAFDYRGQELGRIEKVGGGGMQVRLSTQLAGCTLNTGSELLVDILEGGKLRHSVRVTVRFRDAFVMGLEFAN